MQIREGLIEVLSHYGPARQQTFAGHPLADTVRSTLAAAVRETFASNDKLVLVKGSAGQGNWARGPWVAIFNQLVTESAQRGFYPVYLFREDLSGVYLSLNQGMTEAKAQYRANAKTALRARAANFRAILGSNIGPFSAEPINLSPSSPNNDTAFYETRNICSIFYAANLVPNEKELRTHLAVMMQLYELLIDAEPPADIEELPIKGPLLEGDGKKRHHFRIERNRKLIARVKQLKGERCEACDMTFKDRYGPLGTGFIEAHHRVPFAKLKGHAVPLDPVTDFAVLCSNCHRMAHRMTDPGDISALRALITTF